MILCELLASRLKISAIEVNECDRHIVKLVNSVKTYTYERYF